MYDLLKGKLEGLQGELMSFAQALLRTRSLSRDESSAATLVERQLAKRWEIGSGDSRQRFGLAQDNAVG